MTKTASGPELPAELSSTGLSVGGKIVASAEV
jgi:hypothetical protein